MTLTLVAGSRDISAEEFWANLGPTPQAIISGGARGVDQFGEEWARRLGIPCEVIRPDWDKFGRAAGMYRNSTLVERCSDALIYWDGESRGTLDTMDKLRRSGKPWTVWIRGMGWKTNGLM